jgi:hypothetical protein
VPRGLNEQPIPYEGRLLRCVRRAQEHAAHVAIIEQLARETGGNVQEAKVRHTAVDAIAARGVPLVGPGCAGGAIFGTRPESALMAKQPR